MYAHLWPTAIFENEKKRIDNLSDTHQQLSGSAYLKLE